MYRAKDPVVAALRQRLANGAGDHRVVRVADRQFAANYTRRVPRDVIRYHVASSVNYDQTAMDVVPELPNKLTPAASYRYSVEAQPGS